jgi:hypothetical protein
LFVCLQKHIDLKEFTAIIKSKIETFNDQMLPSAIISFILHSASKEIKVDIENWIDKSFKFSYGYKFNCNHPNNGVFSDFVLNTKVDHGKKLNIDDYLKNLEYMLNKSCSNCHASNTVMIKITNLPEVFLIQIENQANQEIEYGIEDIIENSKSICLSKSNSTTFNWHLFSEAIADILTYDQFYKHQPSFFAYRRMSKNEKDLQAKIMEKTHQEKSKRRENKNFKNQISMLISINEPIFFFLKESKKFS